MLIHCCECDCIVMARLTDGAEIYPHRPDLYDLPFWKCDTCANYVGCHHKTKQRTRPLGNIPNKAIKVARQHIHRVLDPLWQKGKIPRGKLYAQISKKLGYQYHTGEIKSVEQAREIYTIVTHIRKDIL